MLYQLQHKRFTIITVGRQLWNVVSSMPRHCYEPSLKSIAPTGNMNDRIHKRPDCVRKGV
jgi:hypothetical protein